MARHQGRAAAAPPWPLGGRSSSGRVDARFGLLSLTPAMEAFRQRMPWPMAGNTPQSQLVAPTSPAESEDGMSDGARAASEGTGSTVNSEMMNALKELIMPLSRSVDSLGKQIDAGVREINIQISGIQGQMIQAEKTFRSCRRHM